MPKFAGNQLSLITDFDFQDYPVGDYHFDELGSDKFNSPLSLLRTNRQDFIDPLLASHPLGSNMEIDPNPISQSIPLGSLEQKRIKNDLYWYWRYYKISGVRASIYLGKDYTKAIRKVLEKGYPVDAKPISIPKPASDPQKVASQTQNPLYCFPRADSSDKAA